MHTLCVKHINTHKTHCCNRQRADESRREYSFCEITCIVPDCEMPRARETVQISLLTLNSDGLERAHARDCRSRLCATRIGIIYVLQTKHTCAFSTARKFTYSIYPNVLRAKTKFNWIPFGNYFCWEAVTHIDNYTHLLTTPFSRLDLCCCSAFYWWPAPRTVQRAPCRIADALNRRWLGTATATAARRNRRRRAEWRCRRLPMRARWRAWKCGALRWEHTTCAWQLFAWIAASILACYCDDNGTRNL